MKNHAFFRIFSIAFTGAMLTMAMSCTPDQVSPTDKWCTAGINVSAIDDSQVPASLKNKVFAPTSYHWGVGHANYRSNKKMVIIPYQFSTEFPRNTAVTTEVIRTNFFQTGVGSVKDYFLENSWGQYSLQEGGISNTSMLANDPAFYSTGQLGGDWTRNAQTAADICNNSDINWAALDTDNNMQITPNEAQICFLGSLGGGGACRPSSIQVGNYQIVNQSFVYFDCKRDNDPNKAVDPISYNYSTIWHELCHGMFNLPDRYQNFCGSGFTGQFDIMSDNCSWRHMNIYDKIKLGWIRPKILEGVANRPDKMRHCYTFNAVENAVSALILCDRANPDEYWIVENRHKDSSPRGFERDLPESGLAVWWVNANTNEIHLVDANNPSERPSTYNYTAGAPYTGAFFKNTDATQAKIATIVKDTDGILSYILNYISPSGSSMSVDL